MLIVQLFTAFLDYLLRREQIKLQTKQQVKHQQNSPVVEIHIYNKD